MYYLTNKSNRFQIKKKNRPVVGDFLSGVSGMVKEHKRKTVVHANLSGRWGPERNFKEQLTDQPGALIFGEDSLEHHLIPLC